jgi:hypothetical protein
MSTNAAASRHYILRIYDLCIEGIPAKKICGIIGRDKAQVSRTIQALIRNGFLVCINPGDKVRFYEATKKRFTGKDVSTVSTIQQRVKVSTEERGSFIRVHAIRFISTVEKMGIVPWDKKWCCKETEHYFMHYPFLNVGKVGFEWIKTKRKSKLIIHMPSIRWNASDGNPELFLRGMADQCGTWFMKRYHCDLRGLRQCGRGHFEMPVHDKALVKMAQSTSVHVGDFVLDSSLGYPEFGSVGGFDPLNELLGLPKRVDAIEVRIDRLEQSIEKLVLSVDKLTRLFEAPKIKDSFRDVA